jgi:hypothetical protein
MENGTMKTTDEYFWETQPLERKAQAKAKKARTS